MVRARYLAVMALATTGLLAGCSGPDRRPAVPEGLSSSAVMSCFNMVGVSLR